MTLVTDLSPPLDLQSRKGISTDLFIEDRNFSSSILHNNLDQTPSTPVREDTLNTGPSKHTISPATQRSMDHLDAETHAKRMQRTAADQDDKQTGDTYRRHQQNYVKWWCADQARRVQENPMWKAIDAHPITAAKVALFLEWETTRPKRKHGSGETIPGSSVGKYQVAGVISALENWRFNHQHEYRSVAEAQVPLRMDNRIKTFEQSAKHNEPKRVEKSQALKAAGTSSDTYTTDELLKCSRWCFADGSRSIFVSIRDRAMLLLSTATAFRGESLRILQWSDLFLADIPVHEIALGHQVHVLAALADNAKHNQNGRVDEHGALRHRLVELCPVGAIAMLFFVNFHLQKMECPSFEPDFSEPNYGEYGKRVWYDFYVFSGSKGASNKMSYDNHRERLTIMHQRNNVAITKVTHAGRCYAAQTARTHGASVSGTKALGGWNEASGSFRQCYDRTFPVDALLGAAMFNGKKADSYFIARDALDPPSELLSQVFPWVEQEQAALELRSRANPLATDIALKQFLRLLVWLRRVLLQDAALIYAQQSQSKFFDDPVFKNPIFRSFAAAAPQMITVAEEKHRLAFKNLPDHMVESLRGVVSGFTMTQQQDRVENDAKMVAMSSQLDRLEGMVSAIAESGSARRGKKVKGKTEESPFPTTISSASQSQYFPLHTIPSAHTAGMVSSYMGATMISITGPSSTVNIQGSPSAVPSSTSAASPLHDTTSAITNQQYCGPSASMPPSTASSSAFITPIDTTSDNCDPRQEKWNILVAKYGQDRLRKHEWDWMKGDWLPIYKYQPVTTISDIWKEWSEGLGGYICVRELSESWGPKWRRNDAGLKAENTRRSKVIKLIDDLSKKHRWDIKLSLRFLAERYEVKFKARAFCDYLTKATHQRILTEADNFP